MLATTLAAIAGVGRAATWAVILLLLATSLLLVAGEEGTKWVRARRAERKKLRVRAKKRGQKGGRRGKKRGRGLLDCRRCSKRYGGPRHVCQLSWKQMQKVRKA